MIGFAMGITTLSSCVSTRYLQGQGLILVRQRIKGTQKVRREALKSYYHQRTDRHFLGHWLYQLGYHRYNRQALQQRKERFITAIDQQIAVAAGNARKRKRLQRKRASKLKVYDKWLQEGNLLMRWGVSPTIYDPQKIRATEEQMLQYLHTKGYFDAKVYSTVKVRRKRASVTYQIEEHTPYRIQALQLRIADASIASLLKRSGHSLLKVGDVYDQAKLSAERDRVYHLLVNHGYFDFNKQYIYFQVDKETYPNGVGIEMVLQNPAEQTAHTVYHLGDIKYAAVSPQATQPSENVQNVEETTFPWQKLSQQLPLRAGQLYRRSDVTTTYRRLSQLGLFKSIYVTHEKEGNQLITQIYASPSDRFRMSNELGLRVNHSVPRPFYKLALQGKNVFKQLECIDLSFNLGAEDATVSTKSRVFFYNTSWGVQLAGVFPTFWLPLGKKMARSLVKFKPTTNASLGYTLAHDQAYSKSTFQGRLQYAWQGQRKGAYVFTPFRLDVAYMHKLTDNFVKKLREMRAQGQELYRSFESFWVDRMAFQLTFSQASGGIVPIWQVKGKLEHGGTWQHVFDLRKLLDKQLVYAQYIKGDVDYTQHVPLYQDFTLAYRCHTGIAVPYGAAKVLPYEQYYFLGGATNMRAWPPRGLGPGTYMPSSNAQNDYQLKHVGELLLQSSIELRKPFNNLLEGACFVDMGNIWMVSSTSIPGAQFHPQRFLQELAWDAGIGLRIRLKAFLIRVDWACKLYDPAQLRGKRWVVHKWQWESLLGKTEQAAWSFGMGYSF